jgi:hypothetical protein
MRRSIRWASLTLVAAAALVAGPAAARSHHRPCSPSKGRLFPRVIAPCNHTVVPAGKVFTFKVRDLNPKAHRYHPFLYLSSKPPRHGRLSWKVKAAGLYDQTRPLHGHKGTFTDRPKLFTFPGYWLVTPGRYYVQASQVDCSVRGCNRYSPVITITVR